MVKLMRRVGISINSQRIATTFAFLALLCVLSFSGTAFASATPVHHAKTKSGFSYYYMEGRFSYHLSHTGVSSFQKQKVSPNGYPPEPCLAVTVTASNPHPEEVHIIMSLFNSCGSTLSNIGWEYTSTAICNGQAYSGPNNSGTLASLSSAHGITVADDYWEEQCLDPYTGLPTYFTFSATGTAQGKFSYKGQEVEGYGSDTTPDQSFL